MEGISKSQVSRLCGEINVPVNAFLDRPIRYTVPTPICLGVRGRRYRLHDKALVFPSRNALHRNRSRVRPLPEFGFER